MAERKLINPALDIAIGDCPVHGTGIIIRGFKDIAEAEEFLAALEQAGIIPLNNGPIPVHKHVH